MLFSNTFSNSLKNLAKIIICFCLVYTPFFANAAVGGWTMSNPVAQGASTAYDGAKQVIIDGKNYIKKGTAIVTPTATGVAKVLAKGVAGVALSVAVEQLLGAVDWVLDPANNQITYTKVNDPNAPPKPIDIVGYKANSSCSSVPSKTFSSEQSANNYVCTYADCNYANRPAQTATIVSSTQVQCTAGYKMPRAYAVSNPNYDPNAVPDDQPKSIPLEVVAAQVISNAEGNTDKKAGAQVATGAAAADIVAEAEADQTGVKARPIAQQLENSASTKPSDEAAAAEANTATGTQTQNPTKPETTDLKLTFPIFCNWAPTVCEAAQTVISFPKTLTNWWETGKEKAESWATSISEAWTATKEYFKEQPKEQENTEVEIEDIPKPSNTVNVSIGDNTCPSMPVNIHTPFNTIQSDLSPVYLCQIATGMKAFFIVLGFFTASLIVGRRN